MEENFVHNILRLFNGWANFPFTASEIKRDFTNNKLVYTNCLMSCWTTQKYIDVYLKNGASKSIVDIIKYANPQTYRVHPDGFIYKTWKLATNL